MRFAPCKPSDRSTMWVIERVTVGLRLSLPENWTSDLARLRRAGVPEDHLIYRTKPEIALQEIDRVRAGGFALAAYWPMQAMA